MMNEAPFAFSATLALVFILLSIGLFLAFARLAKGPSVPDRVVALDLIGVLAVGMIAVYAVATHQPVFMDVAVVMALIAFLGTVAFARYLEKRTMR
jgi:multicomponent Na+:H+ antiporter subunit F